MHKLWQRMYKVTIVTCVTLMLSSCVPFFRAPPPTAADYCDIDPALLAEPPNQPVVLEIWASAPRQHCLRAYAPWLIAQQNPTLGLAVKVQSLNLNSDPFLNELLQAAAHGVAPDLAFVYDDHLPALRTAGYLYSLTECRQQPGLQALPDAVWTNVWLENQFWGVPFEFEIVLLYYNKVMLKKLGWRDAEITTLPTAIADGRFTLNDLLKVARTAVENGVVQPGFAFLPRSYQSQTVDDLYRAFHGQPLERQHGQIVIAQEALLQTYTFFEALQRHNLLDSHFAMREFSSWGNNALWRDAVAHGRTLFAHGYASDWQQMVLDYTDNSAEQNALQQQVGVALLPVHAKRAAAAALVVDSGAHVILAEKASGRQNQAAACRLLAALHRSHLPQRHADMSSALAPHQSGFVIPSYWGALRLQKLAWRASSQAGFADVMGITSAMGVAVEGGELKAGEATEIALQQLRETLSDQLLVK